MKWSYPPESGRETLNERERSENIDDEHVVAEYRITARRDRLQPKKITHSITEITFTSGKKATIEFDLDGRRVSIPVAGEVKAYFDAQFSRASPTALQRKRYATIMNLLRAAYIAGRESAGK
jgi:hypothetical protein